MRNNMGNLNNHKMSHCPFLYRNVEEIMRYKGFIIKMFKMTPLWGVSNHSLRVHLLLCHEALK